jgi:tetratricopeptide (TPR) repeat protein
MTAEDHSERAELARFLAGELAEEERRAVAAHLFRCPRCEGRLLEMLPERPRGTVTPAYRGLVQRVWKEARAEMESRTSHVERERAAAEELWHALADLPAAERQSAVAAEPRYASLGLFELLLDQARQIIFEQPREAEERLALALAVARGLDPDRYGRGSVEAAHARAWAFLANARRVLGDFRAAEEGFERAEEHLFRSWLDPLDEALILELKALLRRGQRRFAEAFELIEEALALYREINEPHLQGRALITKGLLFQYADDPKAAVECLRRGLFLIDSRQEPRLLLVAHHNLIHCLNDSGRHAEAAALIAEARPLWATLGRRLDLVRLAWMEAKVAQGLGRPEESERLLVEVRDELVTAGLAYDAALASLDLAALYVRSGRVAASKRLAAEMLPIFRSREVHREALAALIVFQRAAEMEAVTLSLVEEISRYLEQARANPEMRFRAGGED